MKPSSRLTQWRAFISGATNGFIYGSLSEVIQYIYIPAGLMEKCKQLSEAIFCLFFQGVVLGRGRGLFLAEAQDHAEREPASIIHFVEEVCPQIVYLEGADSDSIIDPHVEPAAERDA